MRVEMLPAMFGMAMWVEWPDGAGTTHRLLVDAGPGPAYDVLWRRLMDLPRQQRTLDLLVVSHIDADHIEGVLRLLQDREPMGLHIGEVWFNGWPALAPLGILGPAQGEMLGALLERDLGRRWNASAGGAGNAVMVPTEGPPPCHELPGGATVTVLSPFIEQLLVLKDKWRTVLSAAGQTPGAGANALVALSQRRDLAGLCATGMLGGGRRRPTRDSSIANGTSIAILLEQDGHRLLIAADAWADVLERGVDRLLAERHARRLDVDAFQLPHHGSRANITESLLDKVRADRYLVTTNGDHYHHPDAEAIELVISHERAARRRPEFVFNYCTSTTLPWANAVRQKAEGYRATYPTGASMLL